MMTQTKTVALGVLLAAAAGCDDHIDLDPLDERTPIEARVRPHAISGGTLAVLGDGIAVAADPDRDLVHVVDYIAGAVSHTIALTAGDEPGRVVPGTGDLVHVVLRGFGGIATLDTATGAVRARRATCPDPRGLAFDETAQVLHVACADGTLLQLPETGEGVLDRKILAPDLRDVVLVDGQLRVSQFRSATLLSPDGARETTRAPEGFEGTVAWHTFADHGRLAMVHQLAATAPVPIDPPPQDDFGGAEGHAYGGGGACQPGIAAVALSVFDDGSAQTMMLPGARLTVDAAISPNGPVALAMPGAREGESTVRYVPLPGEGDGCNVDHGTVTDAQVTSVEYDDGGTLVMFSREPAAVLVQVGGPGGAIERIPLSGEARYDTGHEIFHRATDSGLSCATCHPEGSDDGHTWVFEELGKRRSQALDAGLSGTAPFHWDGEMTDLDVLFDEVLSHRMGGMRQSPARSQSFRSWLFEQQRPAADPGRDAATLVAEGKALFAAHECASCHTGELLGGAMTAPIRGVALQVPTLRRIALRAPYMHDGRAANLDAAVRDMIDSTTQREASAHDIEAISAYLRTL